LLRFHQDRLGAICVCLAAISCGRGGELPFVLNSVASGVWVAVPNPNAKTLIPANVGVVVGDDGVVIIDTLASVDATGHFSSLPSETLLAEVRKITKLPVKFVVNTHHHLDHVGGNRVFADAGSAIVAHQNVRVWLQSENLRPFGPNIAPHQQAFIQALSRPTIAFEQSLDLFVGKREIHIRHLSGHSGSDSGVVVSDAQVVFVGDLLWPKMLATLTDASINDWIATLGALATAQPGAKFVPGHGDVGSAKNVVAFREYLVTLRRLVTDAQQGGRSTEEVVKGVMPAFSETYGSWATFSALARQNILDVDAELRGTKRIPR
jgi:cyclase